MTIAEYDFLKAWLADDPVKQVNVKINDQFTQATMSLTTPRIKKDGSLDIIEVKVKIT